VVIKTRATVKMAAPKIKRTLLTPAEAAEIFSVTPRTILRWVRAGRLRGYRVGPRRVMIDLDDLNNLARRIPTR
jgi:excisionase family DNA binding protein